MFFNVNVMSISSRFNESYVKDNIWEKIASIYKIIGYELLCKILILYYCFLDKNTSINDKAIIIFALGYFILPVDVIPDFSPFVGYSDDLTVILTALESLASSINETHHQQARAKADQIFGK